ncbi:TPA: hypothetical protein N2D16_002739 [Clostridium botulinum]|nr:hypothetical protein [Clostridium botulinum]
MRIELEDLKITAKEQMIEKIKEYENIQNLIGCPKKELRNNKIDCYNCTECLKCALNKSIEKDMQKNNYIVKKLLESEANNY